MKYVFHPAALTEYGEAVEFYAERRVELAQAFINAVEDAISELLNHRLVGLLFMKIFVDV
jgi:plasmid stabilization system protein ParE